MNDVTFFVRETTKSDMPTHEIWRISWSLPKNQHPSSVHRNYTAQIFHQPNPNKATPFHCQCMLKSTTTKIQLLSLFSWIIRWFKYMHTYLCFERLATAQCSLPRSHTSAMKGISTRIAHMESYYTKKRKIQLKKM